MLLLFNVITSENLGIFNAIPSKKINLFYGITSNVDIAMNFSGLNMLIFNHFRLLLRQSAERLQILIF